MRCLAALLLAAGCFGQCYSQLPNVYSPIASSPSSQSITTVVGVGSSNRVVSLRSDKLSDPSLWSDPSPVVPTPLAGRLNPIFISSTDPDVVQFGYDMRFQFPPASQYGHAYIFWGMIGTVALPTGIQIPSGLPNANLMILDPMTTHIGGAFIPSGGNNNWSILSSGMVELPVLPSGTEFYVQYVVHDVGDPSCFSIPFGHRTLISELQRVVFL